MDRNKEEMTPSAMGRRQFIQRTAATVGAGIALGMSGTAQAKKHKDKMGKLGIGVIGCGGRGNSHLQCWKELAKLDKNVEIVAVCDVYRPRLERAAHDFDAKAYMDYRELLNNPKVDIVSIATPDHHHGIQAIDAIKAGKHVYCEKPVTHWRQFEVIKELNKIVKASKCAFQLGTQGMSDMAWHQMRKLVQDGIIGQPIHGETGFFRTGDWGERGMNIDDPNAKPGRDLDWEAFLGDSPKRDFDVSRFFRWRMYEDYAGGPVTDLYPHCLTPVMSILRVGMPDRVVATGGMHRYTEREVPDSFHMLANYPEKVTISVLGTQGNNYQATGNRGSGQKIPVIRGWDGSLTIRDDKIVYIPTDETMKAGKKEQTFDIERGENMLYHLRNLVECAKNGTQDTWSDVELAYRTQTALLMAMTSLRENKVVSFDKTAEKMILL